MWQFLYLGGLFIMHMADALLSPAVGTAMCAVSAGTVAYAAKRVKDDADSEKKLPMMAVAGAFVFAAQMINFTIPVTGSSGHIGGGILLAALLGGAPALLTLSAVLVIQCLFFADGGLLALGCNIFNMGVIPCLLVYPLVFRPLLGRGIGRKRLTLAAVVAVVLGLQLGAFGVVLETTASGVTALPFGTFALLMQPIHLAIGLVEGIVTAGILCFVYQLRPELLTADKARADGGHSLSARRVLVLFLALTVLTAGGLSAFASANPDGLEWSMERVAGTSELTASGGLFDAAAGIQDTTAILPDYADKNGKGTAAAGLLGSALTFALAGGAGIAISKSKKKKKTEMRQ